MSIARPLALTVGLLSGCSQSFGGPPPFTPTVDDRERRAMLGAAPLPAVAPAPPTSANRASLWTGARGSLLGDRRARQQGDILTVVIEIDDRAEISNLSDRSRRASQELGTPQLFGLPQRLDENLPAGANTASLVDLSGQSSASGDGSVSRNERLTLRVAVTVMDVLPNGVLAIAGQQEVRVNFELRELLVSGYVRPEDITRQNEVTYDKIASARISYGGRGQISEMQQPRVGHRLLESVLPF
ncbi:flagellar basal body L-ring protein FlgH [Yoonia litorea]|nr:flagellar basal body L-ring protein FlgH [Yoonia litorea]